MMVTLAIAGVVTKFGIFVALWMSLQRLFEMNPSTAPLAVPKLV
jgi:hypothetical protein